MSFTDRFIEIVTRQYLPGYMAHYIQLANAPRVTDKAKGHVVSKSELLDVIGHPVNVWDDEYGLITTRVLSRLAFVLRNHSDVRRGDVVLLEPFLTPSTDGRYIFDGKNLEVFSDDYGVLPGGFQVTSEFPIKYWVDFQGPYYQVPFNVSEQLPDINVENVYALSFPAIFQWFGLSFVGADNTIYHVMDHPSDEVGTSVEFIEKLKQCKNLCLVENYIDDDLDRSGFEAIKEALGSDGNNILFI